jgi:hypothetical protein
MSLPVNVGFMRLYSFIRPGLQAGPYRVELDQEFAGGGAAISGINVPLDMSVDTVVKHFEVTGPRFSLPSTEIHSVFPPPNSVGPFHNQLPHIALKRRTLPWERPGDTTNPDLPWLALVILTDGEANFMRNVDIKDVLPADVLARVTEQGTCDAIEVTEDIVREVFPREDEFEYLLHVRQVNVNDTENAGDDEDGFMSVVMANRLPRSGSAYGAYLISIEDRFGELPDPNRDDFVDDVGKTSVYEVTDEVLFAASYSRGGGSGPVDFQATEQPTTNKSLAGSKALQYPSAALATATGQVAETRVSGWHQGATQTTARTFGRAAASAAAFATSTTVVHDVDFEIIASAAKKMSFPVLAHWQFTCTDGLDFRQLMSELHVAMLGSEPDAGDPDTFPTVADSGHSQIRHGTRGGEERAAWYRSPFTPREVTRRATDAPFHSADQARTIGGDHIENLSEAAAFEVGRMLALADPSFLQELLRWRRDGFRLLKTASLLDRFGFSDLLTDGLYPVDLGRVVTRDILVGLAGDDVAGLGPRIDLALGIDLADDDAKVIAEGFATSVDRVRSALGLSAELTTRGEKIGNAPSPEITAFEALVETVATELAHLQSDLDTQVEDIARNAILRDRGGRDG